eukprot:1158066-Pelagomonas_calceolata.AAC.2
MWRDVLFIDVDFANVGPCWLIEGPKTLANGPHWSGPCNACPCWGGCSCKARWRSNAVTNILSLLDESRMLVAPNLAPQVRVIDAAALTIAVQILEGDMLAHAAAARAASSFQLTVWHLWVFMGHLRLLHGTKHRGHSFCSGTQLELLGAKS